MVFPFLSPQDNLLPVLFCLWRCVTCSCESRNPDVFLDSSPPQHTPGQVLVDAHPYISFYSIPFFHPHSGHQHFSSGSLPEPPPWSLLLWVVLHHAAGRILVEPRSELVTPCFIYLLIFYIVVVFAIHWHESAMDLHVFPITPRFKLCSGYPVLFWMKPGLCNMN